MGQSRLSGFSWLAIEAAHAKSMNINELIAEFAEIKCRQMRLYFEAKT